VSCALPCLHLPVTAPEPLVLGRSWPVEGVDRERLRFRGVRPGEAFTVCDPGGVWFRARLGQPLATHALAFEAIPSPESPLRLALFQAVLARERMFWVIQKATELGAHWVVPIFTERSLGPDDLEREKSHRWPAAILRAVKQCRRATVPVLLPPAPLAGALALPQWSQAGLRWVLQGGATHRRVTKDAERGSSAVDPSAEESQTDSAALAIGPEGGWTEDEIRLLCAADATPITLGGRVLRAETAALVGLTLLQREHGDLMELLTHLP
jgi:16S rRNA (uracil1498-N3)-methyltransferase